MSSLKQDLPFVIKFRDNLNKLSNRINKLNSQVEASEKYVRINWKDQNGIKYANEFSNFKNELKELDDKIKKDYADKLFTGKVIEAIKVYDRQAKNRLGKLIVKK